MLQLDKGRAMHYLIEELEDRGYNWAYRIVDSNAFGLPQRRRRVLLLASRTEDPRGILLNPEAGETAPDGGDEVGCGFYWTEGTRGLGWAVDAIPTLKGGSTVGIPSPPAIWNPKDHSIVTPDLRDAERLQGFPVDWTLAAVPPERKHRQGPRWRLVGNAVSVPVAEWVGRRLQKLEAYVDDGHVRIAEGDRWPSAAWGRSGEAYRCERSCWPVRRRAPHLLDFLRFKPKDLSIKATAGFLGRLRNSTLRRSRAFERDLERHLARMVRRAAA